MDPKWVNEQLSSAPDSWTGSHVSKLNGGNSEATAGKIWQLDAKPLTIDNLSGFVDVYYKPANNPSETSAYAAGDTHIVAAEQGSHVIVSTSNEGITMSDKNAVAKALNALAGKLYYDNYVKNEKNLTATVKIASGLTSSDVFFTATPIANDGTNASAPISFGTADGRGFISLDTPASPITGTLASDTYWTEKGVLTTEGNYNLSDMPQLVFDSEIISANKNITANATGKNLSFTTSGRTAITNKKAVNMEIEATSLDLNVHSSGQVKGVNVIGSDANKETKLTIRGNVTGTFESENNTIAFYNNGNSHAVIDGDLTVKTIGHAAGSYAYYSNSAIYAGSNYTLQKGGKVDVTGTVNITADGNGLFANGGGAKITVKNGNITVKESGLNTYYALLSQSGTITMGMNEQGNAANDETVQIIGRVGTLNGSVHQNEPEKISAINLGLGTSNSYLQGQIIDDHTAVHHNKGFKGETRLYLQNGGSWVNKAFAADNTVSSTVAKLVGGSDASKAGKIFQKDANDITIGHYEGFVNVYMNHTSNGTTATQFTGGNVHIKEAATNANINMITDNTGINMADNKEVSTVLNNLAGKLFYDGYVTGERKLSGLVKIESGLTASSAFFTVTSDGANASAPILFKENDGKGYISVESPQGPITGTLANDTYWTEKGVLTTEGNYNLSGMPQLVFTGEVISADKNISIYAGDKNLSFTTTSGTTAIINKKAVNMEIEAASLDLNVHGSGQVKGVNINGNDGNVESKLTIRGNVTGTFESENNTIAFYNNGNSHIVVDGNLTVKTIGHGAGSYAYYSNSAIYAGSNYKLQKGGKVDVNGTVAITADGNGLFANGGGAAIKVKNGSITVNEAGLNTYYALLSQSGTITMGMNTAGDAASDETVQIIGNVATLTGSVNTAEPAKISAINLGLGTSASYLQGQIIDTHEAKHHDKGFKGETKLYLQNGASWVNKSFKTDNKMSSKVATLVGGSELSKAGKLYQKDKNDIIIDHYEGFVNVYMNHGGNGTTDTQFAGGNAHIKKAAEHANLNMITDNTGINMANKDEVHTVLNTLAGKLFYDGYVTGEKHLSGLVKIESGLTSSSAFFSVTNDGASASAPMLFREADGRGYIAAETAPTPGTDPTPPGPTPPGPTPPGVDPNQGQPQVGDYETDIMKGTRIAVMDGVFVWRNIANADMNRLAEIDRGAGTGPWAHVIAGKYNYEASHANFSGHNYGIEVGYDKLVDHGVVGLGFTYANGDADYLNNGSSKHKVYGMMGYMKQNLGNEAYVDVIARVGKVETDFTAYNSIGTKLTGNYGATAYGLHVQLGKQFVVDSDVYVEPQMSLSYSRVGAHDFVGQSGQETMGVKQEAYTSMIGRAGIEVGKKSMNGSMFARIAYAHDFSGTIAGQYIAKDGGVKSTSFDVKDSWLEASIGVDQKIADNTILFAELSKSLTGNYREDWKASVRLQYQF